MSHFAANRDAEQRGADDLAQLGLGQQQEVLGPAPPHPQGRDQPALRRQQQRVDDLAGGDVVGDHPLEVVLRVRAGDPDIRPRPRRDSLE